MAIDSSPALCHITVTLHSAVRVCESSWLLTAIDRHYFLIISDSGTILSGGATLNRSATSLGACFPTSSSLLLPLLLGQACHRKRNVCIITLFCVTMLTYMARPASSLRFLATLSAYSVHMRSSVDRRKCRAEEWLNALHPNESVTDPQKGLDSTRGLLSYIYTEIQYLSE